MVGYLRPMPLRALLLLAAIVALPSLAAAQGTPTPVVPTPVIPTPVGTPAEPPPPPAPMAQPPELASGPMAALEDSTIELERIVAVVGTHPILLSDVFTDLAYRRQQGMPAPRDSAHLDSLMRDVIDELVNVELLVAEAGRKAILVADDEVRPQVEQVVQNARTQAGSDERLREELQRAGLGTMEQWRRSLTEQARKRSMQEQLLAQLRRDGELPPAPVSEAEIAAAFERLGAAERPRRPATLSFRQIILAPEPTAAARAAARARIDSVRAELVAGADFAAVARRVSMDGTAPLGGDLGWVRRGRTVPAFEQWAFSLPVGQLSPPVETSFGYHLIRVDSRQPAEVKVRHILVIPEVDSTDFARTRVLADSVVGAWRSGASYDEIMGAHHDPDEQSLVADFQLDQLPPQYQEIVRGLQPQQISAPFEIDDPRSPFPKLVILQMTRFQPEGDYTLDDVRLQFRQQLGEQRAFERYIAQLRGRAHVEVRL